MMREHVTQMQCHGDSGVQSTVISCRGNLPAFFLRRQDLEPRLLLIGLKLRFPEQISDRLARDGRQCTARE